MIAKKIGWGVIFVLVLISCRPTAVPPTPTAVPATRLATATAISPPTSAPVLAATAVGNPSIGDPYSPQLGNSGYDVQRYQIALTLDPAQPYYLDGQVTIDAQASIDQLTAVSLDFVGYDIHTLQVDGQDAPFDRQEGKLWVTLPRPLAQGSLFQIEVGYQGESTLQPSAYANFASWLGPFYADEGTIYMLSEPDGSRYWFPNNDHPQDKASFRFEITVPAGLTAVANGTLLSQQDNRFVWQHDAPMAPYLATIAVGKYERLEGESPAGVPLRHYVFPGYEDRFIEATRDVGPALDWMSELLGPYPYEAFGYVTVHATGVSLETQTMVLLSTQMLNQNTAVHELAHMWFGNWVSLASWGEMWRNEGFATYFSYLWEFRDDEEGLALQMEAIRAFVEEVEGRPLVDPPQPELFGAYTYLGGALLVHDLRLTMGNEAFFAGLRAYFAEYGGGTASDSQFIEVMEAAHGRSLRPFFDAWLP